MRCSRCGANVVEGDRFKSDAKKVYSFDYEPPVSMVAEDPAPYGAKKED